MNTIEIIIVIAAVSILAADIAVRLVIAPHKRDRFVAELFNSLYDPGLPPRSASLSASGANLPESLGDGLLRLFIQSWLSCRIVDILATKDAGMRELEILIEINALLVEKGRQPLPEIAVRKVLMNLMGADFVTLQHGSLWLTQQGRHLHSVLERHRHITQAPGLAVS